MSDAERHQQLPELSDDEPVRSPREPDPEQVPDETDMDMSKPLGRPTRPVSQWRLLKIIREQPKGRMALADLRWMFELDDDENAQIREEFKRFICHGLEQLVRAGRLRKVTGPSRRTGGVGVVYLVTAKGSQNEPAGD